jgi:1-acyl-sn-glycerol-3-phosphate acyltransferase
MRLPYRFVRPLARVALKTYFNKIYLNGLEKIPSDKPVILAANHPSAFLEPCILATTLPKPLYFMVRGDFFQKPIYRILLKSLHMIPMYRLKDIGIKGVKNNFSSFAHAYDLLKENKQILILAEGTTRHEKRLRPIQKGPARMAIGAIDKYKHLEVQIVPVGVNYTNILDYRSQVMIEIGDPIDLQSILKEEEQHPAKQIQTVTKKLAEKLAELVIIIDKKEDEPLCEGLFQLYRNNQRIPKFPVQSASNKLLEQERKIAQKVNQLPKEVKLELFSQIQYYQADLAKHGLVDNVIVQPHIYSAMGGVGLVLGFMGFLIGYITNILPIKFGKYIADTKVKGVKFYASVSASVSLGAYIIYFSLLVLFALFFKSIFLFFFVLMIPFFGFFALQYYEFMQKWKNGRQFYRTEDSIIYDLKKQRKSILRGFEKY